MGFLTAIWQGVPGRKAMLAIGDGDVKRTALVDTPEEAERFAKRNADCNVFFTPAGFETKRGADNAVGAGCFWLDIDCGPSKDFPDQAAGAAALQAWLGKREFPSPSIVVSSGYGLHAYWLLTQPFARDAWLSVAQKLKQLTVVDGFKVDPSRTADIASVLRLPGTKNLKYGDSIDCSVLFEHDVRYTLHDIEKHLPKLGPVGVPKRHIADDEDVDYAPGNLEAVLKGCQQIRNSWGQPGTPEPLWRASLSVLARCDAGPQAVHGYSQGDPRYSPADAEAKARATKGPLSCDQFSNCNPGGCEGCPSRGTVRSPIQLKSLPAVAVASRGGQPSASVEVRGNPWPFNTLGIYTIAPNGVYVDNKGSTEENAPETLCISKTPVWVSAYRNALRTADEPPYSEVELSYYRADGALDRAVIDAGTFADKRKFEADIRHMSLTGVMNYPSLKNFLSSYMDEHVAKIGIEKAVKKLGWCEEGFCVGTRIITSKGAQATRVLSNANVFKGFHATGTLKGWTDAVEVLNHKRYRALQFAVGSGFASPLLEFVDKQAAVIVLTGETGGGKTTAAKAALSIFGPPDLLTQEALQSTDKGLAALFSTARHCPVLVDEIGPVLANHQKFGNIVYMAANGNAGSSMNRNRELKSMTPWKLQALMTSNLSVLDLPANQLIPAHRARIIELYITEAMPRDHGAALKAAQDNAGQACVPYLQALAGMRDKLPDLYASTLETLDKRHGIPMAARFNSWSLAANYLASSIAKSLGLINYDIDAMIEYAAEQTGVQTKAIKTGAETIEDVIPEFLRANADRIIDLRNGMKLDLAVSYKAPVAMLAKHEVTISYEDLVAHLKEYGISAGALLAWINNVQGRVGRQQLSATTPRVKVLTVANAAVSFGDEK